MSFRALLPLPFFLAIALGAQAATFTVNGTGDYVDASPGDGICLATNGACTLRAAINEANALAGGPHTINVPAGYYELWIAGRNEDGGLTGDLDILKSMTIHGSGPGATVVNSFRSDRVFDLAGSTTVTIDGMTIQGGLAPAGGGLLVRGDLTLTNVVVTGNQANTGGGLDVSGTLHVDRSTISENVAWDTGQFNAYGGGINAERSSITITNSTISGNAASQLYGGVYLWDGTLNMTNVTLSGNSRATLGTYNTFVTLTNVTFVNDTYRAIDHGSWDGTHTITLRNTLIAGKWPGDNCNIPNTALIVSLGGNLENGTYCGFPASGNLIGVDPRLAPLAGNSASTPTHALLPGSPALDAGALTGCPATDQRGMARPQNGRCDIGAFEAQPGATYGSARTIPILVDRTGTALFTSQMTIANRGTTPATVQMTYTAATALSATGSGTVSESLAPGRQLTFDDALGYLRGKGVPIPSTPGQGGTLGLWFTGLSSADAGFASARTTAPSGPGRAGLAYPAPRGVEVSGNALHVFGLRDTTGDRTNLALVNTGTAGTIVLRVTLYPGDVPPGGSAPPPVNLPDYSLGPGQWKQINAPQLLQAYGLTNAWAKVERLSGVEPFLAYAAFNDNKTDDGSYVPAVPALRRAQYHFLPVLVESDRFGSELVLTNPLDSALEFVLSYFQSLNSFANGSMTLTLQPHEQRIIPGAIDFFRTNGMPVGPKGPTLVGTLMVELRGVTKGDLNGFVGARTSAPAPGGGQYGLFYPAITSYEVAMSEAWVFGLQQDGASRSNLAMVNLDSEPATFRIDVFDAATGILVGTIVDDPLMPYRWNQHDSILAPYGITRGYVRVTRTTGSGRFLIYGVNNDGANSFSGTSDGSYLAMVVGS
jgi:CSLREA domain-containing protein